MSRRSEILAGLLGFAVSMASAPAGAQSNLDAGKSPAQIFANTCNACHRSAREIKRTTPAFMREHYTTGMQEATAMAAYLASIGTDPKAVEQRRKPTLGAGREPPPGSEQPKPADTQADATTPAAKSLQNGRSRRPAESLEAGTTFLAATPQPEHPPAAPAETPAPSLPFEE